MEAMQQHKSKLLAELINDFVVDIAPEDLAVAVTGIELDSREISRGDLFIACDGAAANGREFITQAIERGAIAVLVDAPCVESYSVPVIVINQLAMQQSLIAGRFYNSPSQDISLIGVTGTNGKTSCTQFMMQMLKAIDLSCGVIGTLGVGIDGAMVAGINTTPDAINIQRQLAQWVGAVDCVAMEVSSHGLVQGRVAALNFDVALFTNLTREHLDYHGEMANYGKAKALLFKQADLKTAVVNIDDAFSAELIMTMPQSVSVLSYSLNNENADIYASAVQYSATGIQASIQSPWGVGNINVAVLGHFNLSNILASIAGLVALGYDFEMLLKTINSLRSVPGRMELLADSADIAVVVDYAHTSDAIAQALAALRLHTASKLHCVFGCGGDRDAGKRPLMGAAAAIAADTIWVTSDNPRTENADKIISQVLSGIEKRAGSSSSIQVEVDRARAIEKAILAAAKGDVVLIAGKGHEDYQQVGLKRLPFNDKAQAYLALAKRAAA